MDRLRHFLEERSRWFWGLSGTLAVLLLGFVDHQTGFELNVSFFYLVPIFLVSWYAGGRMGLILSAASATIWFLADFFGGLVYSQVSVYVWNTLIRLGFFSVVSYLVSLLRKGYLSNRQMARKDFVTGAVSVGYFYELVQIEFSRFSRYQRPFTIVYMDLDDFKQINDRFGHHTGDTVLRVVVADVQGEIRPSDVFARMGGDEFSLLLPETGAREAEAVLNRIRAVLLEAMDRQGWAVTISMGAVTFIQAPESVDAAIRMADGQMYAVKTNGKNSVRYLVYGG